MIAFRLPDNPLFRQVNVCLGDLIRKSKKIEFLTEKKGLGYLGMTGVIDITRVTSTGCTETWGGWWSDDNDNIEERDVIIPEDVCFIEIVQLSGRAYVTLYLNPVHEMEFKEMSR